jgi:hypothetical protein
MSKPYFKTKTPQTKSFGFGACLALNRDLTRLKETLHSSLNEKKFLFYFKVLDLF